MSFLSQAKLKTLLFLPCVVAPLSVLGSSCLLVSITRSSKRFGTVYHRLLAGLSISDLLFSMAYAMGPWPVPADSILHQPWGKGNTATCATQGFFVQWGYWGYAGYAMGLSIYYVLTICYNWSEQYIANYVEPLWHFVVVATASLTAIWNVVGDFANPGIPVCWVSEYPPGCTSIPDVPCERGQAYQQFGAWVIVYPSFFFTSVNVICLSLVIYTVWQRRQLAQRFVFQPSLAYNHNFNNNNNNNANSAMALQQQQPATTNMNNTMGAATTTTTTTPTTTRQDANNTSGQSSVFQTDPPIISSRHYFQPNPQNSNPNHQSRRFSLQRSTTADSARLTTHITQRMDTVVVQCLLYLANFLVANFGLFFQGLLVVTDIPNEELFTKYFPVLILNGIFLPLQGFGNFVIYIRLKYLAWRRKNCTRFSAFKYAIWNPQGAAAAGSSSNRRHRGTINSSHTPHHSNKSHPGGSSSSMLHNNTNSNTSQPPVSKDESGNNAEPEEIKQEIESP